MIKLSYFAWVREGVGIDSETVEPPPEVITIAQLLGWLAMRSHDHGSVFADPHKIRAARDDVFVGHDAEIGDAKEIALFPPVTGG